MYKCMISVLIFIFTASQFYGETVFLLKDKACFSTNLVPLSCLLKDEGSPDIKIKLDKARFYSNDELSVRLSQAGLKNFSLVGKGIDIKMAGYYDNADSVYNRLKEDFPKLSAGDLRLDELNGSSPFVMDGYKSVVSNGNFGFQLNLIRFYGGAGVPENRTVWLASNPAENKAETQNSGLPPLHLRNVKSGYADMVYQQGNISIVTRVKIRRKLEDNAYLVENSNSGRIMKVVASDSL